MSFQLCSSNLRPVYRWDPPPLTGSSFGNEILCLLRCSQPQTPAPCVSDRVPMQLLQRIRFPFFALSSISTGLPWRCSRSLTHGPRPTRQQPNVMGGNIRRSASLNILPPSECNSRFGLSQTLLGLTKLIENIINFYSTNCIWYENIFHDKPNSDYLVS